MIIILIITLKPRSPRRKPAQQLAMFGGSSGLSLALLGAWGFRGLGV